MAGPIPLQGLSKITRSVKATAIFYSSTQVTAFPFGVLGMTEQKSQNWQPHLRNSCRRQMPSIRTIESRQRTCFLCSQLTSVTGSRKNRDRSQRLNCLMIAGRRFDTNAGQKRTSSGGSSNPALSGSIEITKSNTRSSIQIGCTTVI